MAFIKNTFGASKFGEKISQTETKSKMNDKSLWFRDESKREIIINPTDGMLAKDANGITIHDIPTNPFVVAQNAYLGHLILLEAADQIITVTQTYRDGSTYFLSTSTPVWREMSTRMPTGLTNPHGVYLRATPNAIIERDKHKLGAYGWVDLRYGMSTASVGAYNVFAKCDWQSVITSGTAVDLSYIAYSNAAVPMHFITTGFGFYMDFNFAAYDMTTSTAVTADFTPGYSIWLMGIYV